MKLRHVIFITSDSSRMLHLELLRLCNTKYFLKYIPKSSLSLCSPNTYYFIFAIITWKYGIANLGNLHKTTKNVTLANGMMNSTVLSTISVNILLIIFEIYHVLHVCFPNYILTKMDQNSNDYLRNSFSRLLWNILKYLVCMKLV